MTPGTILCDDKFKFSDGTTGKKLVVTLCSADKTGYYIVVKTTSQKKNKSSFYGCHSDLNRHYFFLPEKSCDFSADTWIMLDEFFDLSTEKLLTRRFSEKIKMIGKLSSKILSELLQCAISSQDISIVQARILEQELQQLLS